MDIKPDAAGGVAPFRWASGRQSVRHFLLLACIAAAYLGAAKLGLSLAIVAEQVTTVWPPTGIALAAVLLFGYRVWPGIWIGAFVANLTTPNESAGVACGIAIGNTLEAVVGAWLLVRMVDFRISLDRLKDVLGLVVLAAGVSTMVSATIGAASLCLGGAQHWSDFALLWRTWWLGDAMGGLLVAPVLLAWAACVQRGIRPRRAVEAIALVVALLGVGRIVFTWQFGAPGSDYPLEYLVFPFVIWAGLRLGQPWTATVVLAASAMAIWGTVPIIATAAHGAGPFARFDPRLSLDLLQIFMGFVSVTGLVLSAAVTERNMADEAFRVGRQRLDLVLGSVELGLWYSDLPFGELMWNDKCKEHFGLPPEARATIERFYERLHPEDRQRTREAIQRSIDEHAACDIEYRTIAPDGRMRWIRAIGRGFYNRQGRPTRFDGITIDITGQKQAQEALQEADRRKNEFLAMLAHELRNPLAPISNGAQLLEMLQPADPDIRGASQVIGRQVEQLTRLVDDLLDVSRITRGKVTLQKQRTELGPILERAVETSRPLIDARKLRLSVSLPLRPIWLDGDAARLAQVFANLLNNSAKYTPQNGEVWLSAREENDRAVVSVRDTGMGIVKDLLPRIFDLFMQADRALDRSQGGLGIGLTVARRLVEMHDGSIQAHSPGPGQGSEFVVRLPCLPVPADDNGAKQKSVAAQPSGARRRILVVDDNKDSAETMARLLRYRGHDVATAYDGPAAIAAAKSRPPEVVLLDIGLPDMDGYEVARQFQQDPALAAAFLVAMTGYGRPEDRRCSQEAGFARHLVKPVGLAELESLLGELRQVQGSR